MKLYAKIIRKIKKIASIIILPKSRKKIYNTRVNGYELLVLANEDVGRYIVFDGRYEPDETAYFYKNIRDDDVCLDVGANIGYYTLLMARCARQGSVHAFEPIPLNASLLRVNRLLNGRNNIIVNENAVGNNDSVVSFSVSNDSAYSSIKNMERSPEVENLTVSMTTIDTYLRKSEIGRVDVIKIDVEGAEELVLIGAELLLSDPTRAPRFMMIELYAPSLNRYGTSIDSIIERLRIFNYYPYVILDDSGEPVSYDSVVHAGIYNVLFLRKSLGN